METEKKTVAAATTNKNQLVIEKNPRGIIMFICYFIKGKVVAEETTNYKRGNVKDIKRAKRVRILFREDDGLCV